MLKSLFADIYKRIILTVFTRLDLYVKYDNCSDNDQTWKSIKERESSIWISSVHNVLSHRCLASVQRQQIVQCRADETMTSSVFLGYRRQRTRSLYLEIICRLKIRTFPLPEFASLHPSISIQERFVYLLPEFLLVQFTSNFMSS